MNFELYEKQQQTTDLIIDKLENDSTYVKNNIYVSGEMGVGKTYIGAYLGHHYKENYNIFVVSPKININKWSSLLGDVKRLKRTTPYDEKENISIIAIEDLNTWINNQNPVFNKPTVLIFDEIHLATKTRYEAFSELHNRLPYDKKGIYLTGTIMEGEHSDFDNLLRVTHPFLRQDLDVFTLLRHNFLKFIYLIWQHISVSLSLDDVQALEENREEIKQEIAPIDTIPLTREQELFSNAIGEQLRFIDTPNQRRSTIITSYIDNPNKSLIHKKNNRASLKSLRHGSYNHLAVPLMDLDFKNTSKYKALKDLINDAKNKNEKVLVYANEEELIQELKNALESDGIKAFTIESVKQENYSEYINQSFNTCDVGVVNPLKVNVGVDIHAEQLVWYQLMPQLDKMIQAQRRVCRLSSTKKSLVTLMVYDTESEYQRALDLSNATKNNAVTYGVQQKDSLAKLTGVVLGQLG